MEITTADRARRRITDIPRKPLDNPARPKPTYSSDAECAGLLELILRDIPAHLEPVANSAHPLLEALIGLDDARGTDFARQLIFVAAATHRTADERRTAEYLLRNRDCVAAGRKTPLALLLAARCAAEMDVRRVHARETPVPSEDLALLPADRPLMLADHPSVGELVLETLRTATGQTPTAPLALARFRDAVAIALELAERHALNGGKGPSLMGMRSDARKEARLLTHLCGEFGNDRGARSLARLLVGADGTPIENALLWWSARPTRSAQDVPPTIRDRWVRYQRAADAAFDSECKGFTGPSYPQTQLRP